MSFHRHCPENVYTLMTKATHINTILLINSFDEALNEAISEFVKYCKNCRLIPKTTKTIVSCFPLKNRAATL